MFFVTYFPPIGFDILFAWLLSFVLVMGYRFLVHWRLAAITVRGSTMPRTIF